MFITSPENFASWFNQTFPGAYRRITAGDVRGMTACGLICHYRTYSLSRDGETVRGILQYEQMREKQSTQPIPKEEREPPKCKMCGQLLPIEQKRESGRPKEYCPKCETLRAAERSRKHREYGKLKQKPVTEKPLVYH